MSAWNCFRVRAESCWPERRIGDELFNYVCVFFHLLLGGAAGGSCYPQDDQFLYRRLRGALQSLSPVRKGVWYEMRVHNPVDFLFKNTDPQGSLRANVANATVRSLSNMPLEKLLENRHEMSRVVRQEVSPKSDEWGYQLGSVYVRKVHFRDSEMIRQIEHKVVNRLRQVTSAIRQAGTNQVDIITSAAERQSAAEFARARSVRPKLVGEALREIGQDPEVLDAVFETLEVDRIVKGNADVTLVPNGQYETLVSLLAGGTFGKSATDQPPPIRQ